jgi:hypothetical protein
VITSKQAARMRHKQKHGKLGAAGKAKLDEYDAARARGDKPPSSSSPTNDQQSAPETVAEAGAVNSPPGAPSSPEGAAPAAEPLPTPEAPPKVKIETASSSSSSSGGAWQDKYRKVLAGASADGREMLCTMLAGQFLAVMDNLATDIRSIPGKQPVIDPKELYPLYVLGFDQLLPDRARLTPGTAAVVGSGAIVAQRVMLHKEITAAQKQDPNIQKWKREQAEAEAKAKAERAERVAKAAEQGIKPVVDAVVVETAEPPSSPASVSLVNMPSSKSTSSPSSPPVNGVAPDGKLLL